MKEYEIRINCSKQKLYPLMKFVGKVGFRFKPTKDPRIDRLYVKGYDILKKIEKIFRENNISYKIVNSTNINKEIVIKCLRCGKRLKDGLSIELGYGRLCYWKMSHPNKNK